MKFLEFFLLLILIITKIMSQTNLPAFDKLWDYDNPSETENKFREILPLAENSGDTAYIIELLTQIGRTQGLQMKFDDAHKTLDRAEKLLNDTFKRPKIRYLLERGRTYNSSKVYDRARDLFLEAYGLAKSCGEDYLKVDAAHMMGIVEKGDESLKWNEIAIKDAENSDSANAKNWLGALYNNTGWTYHDMGQYEKALELFEKNVVWHTARNSKSELTVAKWCVARTLRSLGRVEEALSKQMELNKEINEKGFDQDGYNFEEIGECLLLLGKNDEAKPYFKQAYELLSKDMWLAENEKDRLERLKKLGGW
jgi:tetratricopeptide (TPR) repeat protein